MFNFFNKPINSRHASNVAIVKKLRKVIDMYPELRFVQILYAVGILDGQDLFYEESAKTLKKMEDKLGV